MYSSMHNLHMTHPLFFRFVNKKAGSGVWRCEDCCQFVDDKGIKTISMHRSSIKEKGDKFKHIMDVLNGDIHFGTKRAQVIMFKFLSTPCSCLKEDGIGLQSTFRTMKTYLLNQNPVRPKCYSKFFDEFWDFYQDNPQFEDTLVCDQKFY